jgi:hypothetical protein
MAQFYQFNELKREILQIFAERGWLSPRTVAFLLRYHRRSMYGHARRLWSWGLLRRRFFGRGTLVYSLSPRGARRLAWLRAGSPRNR